MRRFLGIDLAWAEGTAARPARETGLACIDASGRVLDLSTARGIDEVAAWVARWEGPGAVAAVDGPLVVANATGSRLAEKEVASRYGRLGISAYPSNRGLPAQGAVALRRRLEDAGWEYDDGSGAPRDADADADARTMLECYPYTTLVGAPELGFDAMKPRYKRLAPLLATAERRPHRAAEFRAVLDAVAGLARADPPLDVTTHPRAAALVADGPALVERQHKHLEDLLDGLICAWTAAYWARHGLARSQVLGATDPVVDERGRRGTIIAPARPHQRAPDDPLFAPEG
jgi:predicted RNase H-like nuclease